jgi:hypothetical protein
MDFPGVGAKVRVVRGTISETEKTLAQYPERRYTVVRYTQPHGYAVIEGEQGERWFVHPEALEVMA